MTPTTITSAVPIARTEPTIPSKAAWSRAMSTPTAIRRSLPARTRSASSRSPPNAFTTAIADSASLAVDAIWPSCARRTRAVLRTRPR